MSAAALTRWLVLEEDRRLLVVGGASLDVLHVGGTPTPSAGGAGLYTALAAARAGADVTMLAPRPDPMPPELAPATEMIDWVGPVVPPGRLPRFEIGYHPDGELRLFVETAGAEPELSPDLLDDIADIPPLAFVVPFLDADLQQRFVRTLADRGCLTVASTYAKAAVEERPTVFATAAVADLGFCNRAEAEILFGGSDRAAAGPGRLRFVTLGAEGALVFQGDHRTAVRAPVVEVVDPTGAGDTFCGTTLARLVAGDHPVVAARAGARAASEEVTDVGPAALFGPLAEGPGDPRVRIDPERVAALAELIAGLDELDPFPFVGEGLPEVGAPGALDFFFAATLQQFGFWTERDGRYDRPVIAELDGRVLKGSDYLWAAYLRWLGAGPRGLTPAGQAELADAELARRMADDHGVMPLAEPGLYAEAARAYGTTMSDLGWTPAGLVTVANTSSRPVSALLRALDHVGGYREDPLRKKSALLAVILRQRPERWLTTVPGDDAPPIVDYHVQRTALRTGIVEIVDESLRHRVADRRVLDPDEEDAIRTVTGDAVDRLVELSGRSMGAVDYFLFRMRSRCPEMTEPVCDECPARPACARRTDLFQPVLRTTFY